MEASEDITYKNRFAFFSVISCQMAPPFAPLASLGGGHCYQYHQGTTMAATATAPSSARKAATRARLAAAGAPATTRGRPRRKITDPALYVLSVRLTQAEELAAKAAATSAGLSLAEWTRHAVTRQQIVTTVERQVPSPRDAEYERAIIAIGNNANQLARAWNRALMLIDTGSGIGASDTAALHAAADALVAALAPVTAVNKPTVSRLISGARLMLGIKDRAIT